MAVLEAAVGAILALPIVKDLFGQLYANFSDYTPEVQQTIKRLRAKANSIKTKLELDNWLNDLNSIQQVTGVPIGNRINQIRKEAIDLRHSMVSKASKIDKLNDIADNLENLNQLDQDNKSSLNIKALFSSSPIKGPLEKAKQIVEKGLNG